MGITTVVVAHDLEQSVGLTRRVAVPGLVLGVLVEAKTTMIPMKMTRAGENRGLLVVNAGKHSHDDWEQLHLNFTTTVVSRFKIQIIGPECQEVI